MFTLCGIWSVSSLLAMAILSGVAPTAFAGSITDVGVVYNLSSSLVSSTGGTETFNVTLTANTTGYTGSSTDLLDAVAIKVANDGNVLGESLYSGPPGWTFRDAGINGSGVGCGKPSPNGFDCAYGAGLGVGSNSGAQPYVWVFQLTVNSGTLYTSGDSIKAQYVNSTTTKQVNLTSVTATNTIVPLPTTATPEPASIALMGTFLLGAYAVLRRKL